MTDKRQKATKVKCKQGRKREKSTTRQSIFLEYILSLEKASDFYWSSFAEEHKTLR